jgi:hypothetical protein
MCPLAAYADPLVVHTATPRSDRSISVADRLRLADAVADVLAEAQPEVLRATDTHARVETLSPAGLGCDAPECASALLTPLHARGVVVVSVARGRHREVSLTLRWLDAQGVLRGEQRAEEVVAGWDDAVAMARVSARSLLADIPAATTPTVSAPIATPPVAATVTAPAVVAAPPRREPTYARRPGEILLGGVLIAAGAASATIGLVAVARDGDEAAVLDNGRVEVYNATTRDAVLLSLGGAAIVGGAVLLVHGLRARRSPPAIALAARPLGDGAWVGVGGSL